MQALTQSSHCATRACLSLTSTRTAGYYINFNMCAWRNKLLKADLGGLKMHLWKNVYMSMGLKKRLMGWDPK